MVSHDWGVVQIVLLEFVEIFLPVCSRQCAGCKRPNFSGNRELGEILSSREPKVTQSSPYAYRIHTLHARMRVMAIPQRIQTTQNRLRVGRATSRMLLNTVFLIGFEVFAVVLSVWLSFQVRAIFLVDATIPQLSTAIIPTYILLGWLSGLYPGWALGPVEDLRRVSRNIAATFLLMTGVLYFTDTGPLWARVALLLSGLIAWVLIPMARWLVRLILVKFGLYGVDVAVLGAGKTGEMVVRALRGAAGYGMNPVAIYDDAPNLRGSSVEGLPVVGPISGVLYAPYAAVFVAMPGLPRAQLLELLRGPLANIEKVLIVPDFFGVESLWVEARDLNGTLTLEISRNLLRPLPQALKRLFDLLVILVAAPFWVPVFGLCADFLGRSAFSDLFAGTCRIARSTDSGDEVPHHGHRCRISPAKVPRDQSGGKTRVGNEV
jgi:hypothetical protein